MEVEKNLMMDHHVLQILTKEPLTDGRDRFLYNYMVLLKRNIQITGKKWLLQHQVNILKKMQMEF
jgi:hypothetical protein